MLRRRRRARYANGGTGDEGATLVVAVMVMLVLSTLSLALLTRTLALLQSTRMSQDHQAALAEADAGLADALFELDQFGPTSPAPPAPSGARTTDTGSYHYTTERIDDASYIVRSRGSVGRASHAVSARVSRSAKFPYALFSRQTLTINGGVRWPTGEHLPVGSNATTTCNGGIAEGTLTSRATNNKDCPGYEPLASPRPLLPVTAPAGAQPCPAGGLFEGSISGTFLCREEVRFEGVVDPLTSLAIHILPSADGIHHGLDLGGAHVNVAGPASDVQVYKDGGGPITFDAGNTSDELTFRGVIYAPDSTFDIGSGGKWLMGSFTFNEVKLNGGPNFTVAYDTGLATTLGNDWTMTRYAEIPSSDPKLPAR